MNRGGARRGIRPLTAVLVAAMAFILGMPTAAGDHGRSRSRRPQPVPPHGDIAEPEPVHLGWSEVAAGRGLAELANGTLTLVLTSDLPYQTDAHVGVRVIDGSRPLAAELGHVTVPADGQSRMTVDLAAFDVDFFSLAAPASVVALAEVSHADGTHLFRSYTDPAYAHGRSTAAGGQLLVYDHSTLLARFAGGDLGAGEGRPAPVGRDGFVDGGAGLPDRVPTRRGRNVHTFCLKYKVNATDYGVGEDYHADGDAWVFFPSYTIAQGLWPAHGARLDLFRPGIEEPTPLHASETSGCLSFTSNATTGFTIRLYYEATVGGNTFRVTDEQGNVKFQDIKGDPGSYGTHIYFTNGTPDSSAMGIAAWNVLRLEQVFGNEAPNGKTFDMIVTPCKEFGAGSCYHGAANGKGPYMELDVNSTKKKFAVAHEIGHWFDDQVFNRVWPDFTVLGNEPYEHNDSNDPPCQFTGTGLHALRSQEESTYALVEGVAHFLSVVTWNDLAGPDAVFKYYKFWDPPDDAEHYKFDLFDVAADVPDPAGGVVNWNDNRCHAELEKGFGRSVEGDWLRFFWDYLTDDALGAAPTPQELASQLRSVDAQQVDEFNVYTRFKSVVDSDPRFTAIADVHGVNYPQ
jgi:hypothetical protein